MIFPRHITRLVIDLYWFFRLPLPVLGADDALAPNRVPVAPRAGSGWLFRRRCWGPPIQLRRISMEAIKIFLGGRWV